VALITDEMLQLREVIGAGGFGTVYKANLLPHRHASSSSMQPRTVAVKELKWEQGNFEDAYTEFCQEVYIMSTMRAHPNLVRLYGVCMHPKPRMVLELLPAGDLCSFLHPAEAGNDLGGELSETFCDPSTFPWRLRLLMALDVAKGMLALHSHSPPILHRDLRSPNIFLATTDEDAPVRAKVADFGLSRMVAPTIVGTLHTWQWLAPEVISGSDSYGMPSDVYSFGVVLYEIYTGQYPFLEYCSHPRFSHENKRGVRTLQVKKLKRAICEEGLRPTRGLERESLEEVTEEEQLQQHKDIRKLLRRCWSREAGQRPTFEEVVVELCHMLELDADAVVAETVAAPAAPVVEQRRGSGSGAAKPKFVRRTTEVLVPPPFTLERSAQLKKQRLTVVDYHQEVILLRHGRFSEQTGARVVVEVPARDMAAPSQVVAVGCDDGDVLLWDCGLNEELHSFSAHEFGISAMAVVDGHLWTGCRGGTVAIWDTHTWSLVKYWKAFKRRNPIGCMVAAETETDTRHVWISSSLERTLAVYDEEGNLAFFAALPKRLAHPSHMAQHGVLVWVTASSHIAIFDATTGQNLGSWQAHKDPVTAIAPSVDNVWTSSTGGEVAVWDSPSDLQIRCSERLADGAGGCVRAMAMSYHRMCSSTGTELLVWDEQRREGVQELCPPTDRAVVGLAVIERIGRIVGLCPDGILEWEHRPDLSEAASRRKVYELKAKAGNDGPPSAPPMPPSSPE